MTMKIEGIDAIAIVGLVGCFTALALHVDGIVATALGMIIAYYFGRRHNLTAKSSK